MRDAMNKYKKYGTGDVPPIPALPTTSRSMTTAKTSHSSSVNGKPRTHRKRSTHQKNKILRDVTDMYAIGLGLTK